MNTEAVFRCVVFVLRLAGRCCRMPNMAEVQLEAVYSTMILPARLERPRDVG
jgi:hypothetical protein